MAYHEEKGCRPNLTESALYKCGKGVCDYYGVVDKILGELRSVGLSVANVFGVNWF